MELYANYGSSSYLLDKLSSEAMVFDNTTWQAKNRLPYHEAEKLLASSGLVVYTVNCISIVGYAVSDCCDIYFNGKHANIPKNYIMVYSKFVSRRLTTLLIPYKDKNLKHIIMVYRDGDVSQKGIEDVIGYTLDWQ